MVQAAGVVRDCLIEAILRRMPPAGACGADAGATLYLIIPAARRSPPVACGIVTNTRVRYNYSTVIGAWWRCVYSKRGLLTHSEISANSNNYGAGVYR